MDYEKVIEFKNLKESDLYLDAIYKGGKTKNISSEVLNKLMGVSNQKGFRYKGVSPDVNFCVLWTTGEDVDWPDHISIEDGLFVYYGDNKKPGYEIHSKPGNKILKNVFENLHKNQFSEIPPFFIFEKVKGWDVRFRGLAVPGHPNLSEQEDLIAEWRSKSNTRFQNYKSSFSILNTDTVSKDWIKSLLNNSEDISLRPKEYQQFTEDGKYQILRAPQVKKWRTKEEQLPSKKNELKILEFIVKYYKDRPTDFEYCAAEIWRLFSKYTIRNDNVTQKTVDGGIDVYGKIVFGLSNDPVDVDFILEAKCNSITTPCSNSVKNRLISRIKNRMLGVLVTTSYVSDNAYKEVRLDNHPVVFITGIDIVNILREKKGIATIESLENWLKKLETHNR
tara:strand:- start:87 stop:1262 length:1176 start_codon:yes stop_codon:yes gene_type:complete